MVPQNCTVLAKLGFCSEYLQNVFLEGGGGGVGLVFDCLLAYFQKCSHACFSVEAVFSWANLCQYSCSQRKTCAQKDHLIPVFNLVLLTNIFLIKSTCEIKFRRRKKYAKSRG